MNMYDKNGNLICEGIGMSLVVCVVSASTISLGDLLTFVNLFPFVSVTTYWGQGFLVIEVFFF